MRFGLAGLMILSFCVPVAAQTDQDRFERRMEEIRRQTRFAPEAAAPLDQQVLLQYGAYATIDYFSLDDRFHDNHGGREYALIGYARANFWDAHEFFVRAHAWYRTFNDGDSFNRKGDQWLEPNLERAYYRFDLRQQIAHSQGKLLDWDISFKGGRDLAYWANGLVISEVLDGGVFDLQYGKFSVEAIGGVTPGHTVDFDSSRPYFDNDTNRGFFGGLLTFNAGDHHPFVYGVAERDYNDDVNRLRFSSAGGTTSVIDTRFAYNADYFGFGSSGALTDRLNYALEIVEESGTNLSNSFVTKSGSLVGVPQTTNGIRAYAGDLRLDYLPGDAHRSRISGEALLSSGDSDRLVSTNTFGGNRPHTPDLGFNTLGIVDTGLAFAPLISNITFFRIGGATFPFTQFAPLRRMQLGTDLFVFLKTDVNAPIEEPTLPRRYLGWEPDVYMNWRITSDVTLALRYGLFVPGHAIQTNHAARQFFFAGVTFAF